MDKVFTLNNGYQIAVQEVSRKEAIEMYTDWLYGKEWRTGKWSIMKKDCNVVNFGVRTRSNVARSKIKKLLWDDLGGGYVVYGPYNVDLETGKVTLI